MSRLRASTFLLAWLSVGLASAEQTATSLPEPLTLQAALQLVDEPHPQSIIASAEKDRNQAILQQQESANDWQASLYAQLRWVEPSDVAPDQSDDHRASLFAKKILYDFGKTSSEIDAAQQDLLSSEIGVVRAKQKRILDIKQKFFNVLLADLEFYRYNEEMATEYVALDKLRQRKELGQVSDILISKQEVAYQKIRRLRALSQNKQRITRSQLALALNRPNNLPETVVMPELEEVKRPVPEVETVLEQVLQNNLAIKELRAKVEASRQRIAAARGKDNPVLRSELEVSKYTRQLGSSDKWRAGFVLDVPLWSGSVVDSAVAKATAEYNGLQAQLDKLELDTRQQVLELVLSLDNLRIQRDEAKAQLDYRELYLDRSRALYEMEVKTDLGDSMVRISEAQYRVLETNFAIAMIWSRLDALNGSLAEINLPVVKEVN